MAPIFRSLCCAARSAHVVAALLLAVAPALAQTMVLAESVQAAPLMLGDRPVTVKLAAPQGAVDGRFRALAAGEQVYLVLDRLRSDAAPDAVYEVYFELPAGATPARDHPHYVGDINFFDTASGRRGASFNITDLAVRLARDGALGENLTVTIVPNGTPSAAAHPSIAGVALAIRAR